MVSKGDNRAPTRAVDTGTRPPKVVGRGRRCEKCGTPLNMYNSGMTCGPCRRKRQGGGPPLTGGQAKKL